ncbi:type VI secretion system baseplate subunit TssG [Vibrio vulnificus]|uniref:type VI secretion system baseplate subunit TssG n=1 Tax=Vibrio vulnificus TaxID=672 RepID=UPI003ED89024
MQELTVNRLLSGQSDAELAQTWQLLKHQAQQNQTRPKVRFSSEMLPAYYAAQVTQVYRSPRSGWVVKTGLPALSGNQGTLPRAMYRQALNAQFNLGDDAPVDFFDTFNNRYFRLYCQVEQKHSLVAQMEEERFSWNRHQASITAMLANLYGSAPQVSAMAKSDLIQYTGVIGLKLTCPHALREILQDYFAARFEIEHSGLEYQPLTPCSLTHLGQSGQNQRLGMGALIGKSTAMVGQKLSIKICPSNYRHYLAIRHDQGLVRAIDHLVRAYMGVNIKYKLHMKVSSQYLPRVKLSAQASSGLRIGQSAWMESQRGVEQYVELPLSAN